LNHKKEENIPSKSEEIAKSMDGPSTSLAIKRGEEKNRQGECQNPVLNSTVWKNEVAWKEKIKQREEEGGK